jgi:glycosyltransferase involved in cell wall biosynthesis
MPVAIVEAFYSGLPVVTTNAGGIPYIVRHRENGLVCPLRDVSALASALREVIENAPLRGQLIAAARLDAQKFSWKMVRNQWADQYLSLLGRA